MRKDTQKLLPIKLLIGAAILTNMSVWATVKNDANDGAIGGVVESDSKVESIDFDTIWQQLMERGNHDEAVSLADRWLARVIDEHGKRAPEAFEPLWKRAQATHAGLTLVEARRAYKQVIEHAGRAMGPFDPRLVDPLIGYGKLLLAADMFDEAEDVLLRAQSITQRNDGLFNLEQEQPLTYLADAYVAMGRSMQAQRMQKLKLRANEEQFGNSPELVPALLAWARWNASQERFADVKIAFERTIDILETHYGPDSLELVNTLRLKASLYRLHPRIDHAVSARDALKRVAAIYAAQENVDQVDLVRAYTDIGDWSLRQQKITSASRAYRSGLRQALAAGIDNELINKLYDKPSLVFFYPNSKMFVGRKINGDRLPGGVIIIRYDVRKNGTPARLRVVHDTLNMPSITEGAEAFVDYERFRPRFENGKAVRTRDLEQAIEIRQNKLGLEIGRVTIPVKAGEAPTDFDKSTVPLLRK